MSGNNADDNSADDNSAQDNGVGEERQVCAVCGRILNAYVSPEGKRSWLHTFADLPEDHPAVPVGPGEGIIPQPRCDFCSAKDPAWELARPLLCHPRPHLRAGRQRLARQLVRLRPLRPAHRPRPVDRAAPPRVGRLVGLGDRSERRL